MPTRRVSAQRWDGAPCARPSNRSSRTLGQWSQRRQPQANGPAGVGAPVPAVGALLMFSLMIGPPAAARALAKDPAPAMILAVALALATVWTAIAASCQTNWPVGFFVGVGSATWYLLARAAAAIFHL
ncbi:MAG TPA: metal ABC transporter permease [Thermomicrobiaceae bacterium]|nr:metal ABC transporter permease [Thermomicrobiaceae bacterium]